MKSLPKIFMIVTVIVFVLFLGCSSSNEITLLEIKNNFVETFHNLKSCSFTMSYSVNQLSVNGSYTSSSSVSTQVFGMTDSYENKYYYRVNSTYLNSSGTINMNYENYVVDGILYRGAVASGSTVWGKANATSDDLFIFYGFNAQVSLLDYCNLTRLDDAKVNNVDCYVIKADVDIFQYFRAMINQSQFADEDVYFQTFNDSVNRTKEMSVSFWLSKADFEIMKSYQRTVAEYIDTSTNLTEETLSFFGDHNTELPIVLPADAQNAQWTEFG